ncbi:hypothetical protein ACFWBB_11690 [Streptomyces sp. NPDC060000]|uniref:hypothetical protein n=1 Tax=Streptomyces sp. NPDC060000 TaxID=3347031 RepID=UPI00369030CF
MRHVAPLLGRAVLLGRPGQAAGDTRGGDLEQRTGREPFTRLSRGEPTPQAPELAGPVSGLGADPVIDGGATL